MHKKQVAFSRTSIAEGRLTCVHCGNGAAVDMTVPPGRIVEAWVTWCVEHPCMLPPNPHYTDADRDMVARWKA